MFHPIVEDRLKLQSASHFEIIPSYPRRVSCLVINYIHSRFDSKRQMKAKTPQKMLSQGKWLRKDALIEEAAEGGEEVEEGEEELKKVRTRHHSPSSSNQLSLTFVVLHSSYNRPNFISTAST